MKCLDEYKPNARRAENDINEGESEYLYKNIQSCIAVGITDRTGRGMIGVHFTAFTRGTELTNAIKRIQDMLKARKTTASAIYLAGAYSKWWAGTSLKMELQKISYNIYVLDVKPAASGSADVDVKFVLAGSGVKAYVKPFNKEFMAADFTRI